MQKSEKIETVQELQHAIKQHAVIGMVNMHKLPAKQLQQIRKSLTGKATIQMAKKSLLLRAFKESGKDLSSLEAVFTHAPALLFTNENPFEIYRIIKENKSPSAAKKGDIATSDIVIKKGPTGIPPGPAISTLQKVKLKTSMQGGKIAVMEDKVVCKQGEAVTPDAADVLSLLKMEPMEIGLQLDAVWEDGVLYARSVLDTNPADYLMQLQRGVQEAINLSIETGFLTEDSVRPAIQKAFLEAKSLCLASDVLTDEFADEILMKAVREAKALEVLVPQQSL
ncbi:MAG: 50S ribosomal protein L10 [Candidatus Aenigmarchaeota archaeon]|nr:50S ribosomal protein L10 [Candidatus Aenigmarchaeota archaeon]